MSEQSLADRATAERVADIAPTSFGMRLVNHEVHRPELTKEDGDG
jgi:hypothetical protein